MAESICLHYTVPGDDFTRAGEASADLKQRLKKLGIPPGAVRKVSIALYEGEINLAIHAHGGDIDVEVDDDAVRMTLSDTGPGIADIALAMSEGYSTAPDEVRSLGFGAGMGLPNMKKYSDEFDIQSAVGVGTTVKMAVRIDGHRRARRQERRRPRWSNLPILSCWTKSFAWAASTASSAAPPRRFACATAKRIF